MCESKQHNDEYERTPSHEQQQCGACEFEWNLHVTSLPAVVDVVV